VAGRRRAPASPPAGVDEGEAVVDDWSEAIAEEADARIDDAAELALETAPAAAPEADEREAEASLWMEEIVALAPAAALETDNADDEAVAATSEALDESDDEIDAVAELKLLFPPWQKAAPAVRAGVTSAAAQLSWTHCV